MVTGYRPIQIFAGQSFPSELAVFLVCPRSTHDGCLIGEEFGGFVGIFGRQDSRHRRIPLNPMWYVFHGWPESWECQCVTKLKLPQTYQDTPNPESFLPIFGAAWRWAHSGQVGWGPLLPGYSEERCWVGASVVGSLLNKGGVVLYHVRYRWQHRPAMRNCLPPNGGETLHTCKALAIWPAVAGDCSQRAVECECREEGGVIHVCKVPPFICSNFFFPFFYIFSWLTEPTWCGCGHLAGSRWGGE